MSTSNYLKEYTVLSFITEENVKKCALQLLKNGKLHRMHGWFDRIFFNENYIITPNNNYYAYTICRWKGNCMPKIRDSFYDTLFSFDAFIEYSTELTNVEFTDDELQEKITKIKHNLNTNYDITNKNYIGKFKRQIAIAKDLNGFDLDFILWFYDNHSTKTNKSVANKIKQFDEHAHNDFMTDENITQYVIDLMDGKTTQFSRKYFNLAWNVTESGAFFHDYLGKRTDLDNYKIFVAYEPYRQFVKKHVCNRRARVLFFHEAIYNDFNQDSLLNHVFADEFIVKNVVKFV